MTMTHADLPQHAAATRLTPDEQIVLDQYEQVISTYLRTPVAVGQALRAIRDAKLYRATHASFEAYCRSRWNIGRKRAYQLIDAAAICAHLEQHGLQLPMNERQARTLKCLAPDDQVAAWQTVLMQYPAGNAPGAVVQQEVERRQHVLVVSASAPDARDAPALPAPDPDDPPPTALTRQPPSITVLPAPDPGATATVQMVLLWMGYIIYQQDRAATLAALLARCHQAEAAGATAQAQARVAVQLLLELERRMHRQTVQCDQLQQENQHLRRQTDQLQLQRADLRQQYADLQQQHTAFQQQHADLQHQHAAFRQEHADLQQQHADLQRHHAVLQRRIQELQHAGPATAPARADLPADAPPATPQPDVTPDRWRPPWHDRGRNEEHGMREQ